MKRYLVGMFALMLAFTFSAFTVAKTKSTTQKNWIYDSLGDDQFKDDPAHYYLSGPDGEDPLPCETGSFRCGVIANDNGGVPNLSPNMFTAIVGQP